jgi:putative SOS response-associated peptidase YedK
MPVLLNPQDYASWLDPKNTGRDELYAIVKSIGAGFQLTPLGNDVGNARDKSKPSLAKQASLF